jgi:hypothetical protein
MIAPANLLQWTAVQPMGVGLVVLGVPAVVLTWAGVVLVRLALADTPPAETVVSTKAGYLAETYALLLGMLLVAALAEFQDMQTTVAAEAGKLAAIRSLASGLDPGDRAAWRGAIGAYAHAVAEQEWPELALGGHSAAADRALDRLFELLGRTPAPPGSAAAIVLPRVGELLQAVVDHRAARITNGPPDAAEGHLGRALLVLTVLAIAVPWFLRSANLLVHLVLAGLLTLAYIGLIVMAVDLFYPFAGGMHLGPEPLALLSG